MQNLHQKQGQVRNGAPQYIHKQVDLHGDLATGSTVELVGLLTFSAEVHGALWLNDIGTTRAPGPAVVMVAILVKVPLCRVEGFRRDTRSRPAPRYSHPAQVTGQDKG